MECLGYLYKGGHTMKVCIAMDSFKDSMTALSACEKVQEGLKEANKNIITKLVPMSDGGEGTMQSLVDARGGKIIKVKALNPLFKEIYAEYGIIDNDTAIIEMAKISGLELLKNEERNPMITTTYGTGQLILSALDNGVKNIILGIGGSATNDAGVGMANALGVKFLDENNTDIRPCGKELKNIHKIDISNIDKRLKDVKVVVACDVDNPLTGEKGASKIFGPQKGGSHKDIETLDENLKYFAQKVREDLRIECENIKGAGAAGGLGAGSVVFLNGTLKSGIEIVTQFTQLEKYILDCDLVITGEGKIDGQTIFGKTPIGVAKVAKKHNKKVIGLSGSLGEGYEKVYSYGIDSVFSVLKEITTLEDALLNGEDNLKKLAFNVGKLI